MLALLFSLGVHALGFAALALGLYSPNRSEQVDPNVVRLRLVPGELEFLPAAGTQDPAPTLVAPRPALAAAPPPTAAPMPAPVAAAAPVTAQVTVTAPAQASAPVAAPDVAPPVTPPVTPPVAPPVTPAVTPAAAPAVNPPAELEFTEARPGPDNSPPRYPLSARRRGLEGEVLLRVGVGSDGAVQNVSLWRSSGHGVLDRAALDAVRVWRFLPARRGTVPLAQEIFVPIKFRLLDSP